MRLPWLLTLLLSRPSTGIMKETERGLVTMENRGSEEDATDDFAMHHQLIQTMLRGYNKQIRPVKDLRTATLVNLTLNIVHLDHVNEKEGSLKIHGWTDLSWRDEFLTWAPEKQSPKRILLPQYYIWRPDLHLLNSASGKEEIVGSYNTWARVDGQGDVLFQPPTTLHSLCRFRLTHWPWDRHVCPLELGSWTYDGSAVVWGPGEGGGPSPHYAAHSLSGAWDLAIIAVEETGFRNDGAVWASVRISVELVRRPGVLTFLLLLPLAFHSVTFFQPHFRQ